MDKLLKIVGMLFLTIAFFYLRLIVLIKIYNHTVLHLGAPAITLLSMFSLSMFLHAVTYVYKKPNESGAEETVKQYAGTLIGLLIIWGISTWVFG